jgi:hypothetical protein
MLLNTACTDGEKPEITDNNEEQDSYVHQSKDTMDVLGKELQKELTSFILYEDSLYRKEENYGTWDIYIVNFFTKDDDCFVRFFSSLYYSVKDFSGYVIIENKMVAFYNTEIKCNCGLVNTSLLQHSMTDDYPNDSRGTLTPFEPKGKTFKIHNKDSLELVYSGYF